MQRRFHHGRGQQNKLNANVLDPTRHSSNSVRRVGFNRGRARNKKGKPQLHHPQATFRNCKISKTLTQVQGRNRDATLCKRGIPFSYERTWSSSESQACLDIRHGELPARADGTKRRIPCRGPCEIVKRASRLRDMQQNAKHESLK